MSVWKLISHHESANEAFDVLRETERIAIGWSGIGDLRDKRPSSPRDIAQSIQEAHPSLENSGHGGSSLWNFFAKVDVGDLVLVSGGGRRRGVFQVRGPYLFVGKEDSVFGYQHVRQATFTHLDPDHIWKLCDGATAAGENHMWTMVRLDVKSDDEQSLRTALQTAPPVSYWLNLDQRGMKQMLHIEGACGDVRQVGKFAKKVGHLGDAGGWFNFDTAFAANEEAKNRVVNGFRPLAYCSNCRKTYKWFDAIGAARVGGVERLSAAELGKVSAEHLWNAIRRLEHDPLDHGFGPSIDYDVLLSSAVRLAPKAVFGLAASEALGFEVQPGHFAGGLGTPCFRLIQDAGYLIVPKGRGDPPGSQEAEDREWAEGSLKVRKHLHRERAPGLSAAKKANFRRLNGGRLFCEQCRTDPASMYGELGEACIEVHHAKVMVSEMAEGHVTTFEDLQCLCANCHRVEHRRLKKVENAAPAT